MNVRSTAVWALAAVVVFVGAVWLFQRRLIYLPSQRLADLPAWVEDVGYETADGLTLRAWFLPVPDATATVLVFNGNAGNRSGRLPLADALRERGFAVLLVDYRGYGGNPGRPSETGLASDARAALSYALSRPEVDPSRIAYFGESLGAAVALRLASEDPPAGLILRSPFSSLAAVASVHYPFLPNSWLLRDHYPNIELIADVDVPVLVIAGSADRIVPLEQSRALFDAARRPHRFVTVEGADHNDWALLAGEESVEAITAFLAAVLPAGD